MNERTELSALQLSAGEERALRTRITGRIGEPPAPLPSLLQLGLERTAPGVSLIAMASMIAALVLAEADTEPPPIDARALYVTMRGAP